MVTAEHLGPALVRVRLGNALKEKDPLSYWHFSSRSSRDGFALITSSEPVDELHLRAANKGGKTEAEYAYGIACLQKRTHLDGVPLPQWRGRVEGISLELDHEQQKLSSQQTVLRLLGQWPHKPRYLGDVLKSVRIMPIGGGEESQWSTLSFMTQENRRSGTGVRSDLVLANEPPRQDIWEEIRKAAHAGRRIVRIIGETPIHRLRWEWIKKQYGDPPRGSVTRLPFAPWAEARWSIHDNQALTAREIDTLLREYGRDRTTPDGKPSRDALYDARVYGDYVDLSGLCPFDLNALHLMLEEWGEDPVEHAWDIQRELQGEDGFVRRIERVYVHVLREPVPGHSYYLNIDSSSGIEGRHPGGILVRDEDADEDVALYEGYIGAYGLGVLGAGLARQYNDSWVDPENNAWAEGVFRGLADSGYGKIAKTQIKGGQGAFETRLGFMNTLATRPAMIEAVQEWVKAYAAGIKFSRCGFRRVIHQLAETVLDDKDRVVAGTGFDHHGEFLILKGQQLRKRARRIDHNLARPLVKPVKPERDELLERMLQSAETGHTNGDSAGHYVPPRYRPRPR